jgi:plasmid stabilization system protein ParE
MRLRLEIDPDAQIDFNEASDWYREQDEAAKAAFIASIKTALEAISLSPNSFPPEEDRVFVHAIFHTSRNPMIWHGRIS